MTKEDWAYVEETLKSPYKIVKLNCDGYILSLRLRRVDVYKLAICVRVNGELSVDWIVNDCEERRRFFRKTQGSILSASGMKIFRKLSKKKQEEWRGSYFYDIYLPYWTSFRSLKKHLIENNKSIELVKEE